MQPTFVYDFPTEVSPLSKQKDGDPDTVERFELYAGGFEVANGFSELNDPAEQRRRFEAQLRDRAAGNAEAHAMDEDYIRALEYGLPPTGGEGNRDRSIGHAPHQQPVDSGRDSLSPHEAARRRFRLMGFAWFVARRYLTARRKQAFISLISGVSILGVGVGVMALIIASAIMTGVQTGSPRSDRRIERACLRLQVEPGRLRGRRRGNQEADRAGRGGRGARDRGLRRRAGRGPGAEVHHAEGCRPRARAARHRRDEGHAVRLVRRARARLRERAAGHRAGR